MNERILIMEDDKAIKQLLEQFLSSQGYIVTTANDGLEGLELWNKGTYDLVLSDIMMPNLNGNDVLRIIRQQSDVPVILLSALSEEHHQIEGFDNGSDDYLTKPFSYKLLIKRVEAVLRRAKPVQSGDGLEFHELRLDVTSYNAYVDNVPVELTTKEFDILHTLVENAGKIVTREQLLDKLWGYDYFGDTRIIDTHLKNIRKKTNIPYIKTVKGVGYKLER
ncbi:response regulator transcription factor [Cohnella lupini]|uniref:Two-component system response regulator VanR n=1 Tax=Cohnella lupini TaxID=1294267 RepID=A0A3D9IJD5_9BACL|nr:response regulator transcription factor [Cohnella lupini]RED61811.1 two-component system response regulator VanR [Cohnella lupini]